MKILLAVFFLSTRLEAADFAIPFKSDYPKKISQAFGGKFSHSDLDNLYAIDIAMPEGTLITAAKSGTVVAIEQRNIASGNSKSLTTKSNYISIQHRDGTVAEYMHLRWASIRPRLGSFVRTGQIIAQSGNVGYTTGPHLHFVIKQKINGNWQSVPFSLMTVSPREGMRLPSS